jgi:hypothetical protein
MVSIVTRIKSVVLQFLSFCRGAGTGYEKQIFFEPNECSPRSTGIAATEIAMTRDSAG